MFLMRVEAQTDKQVDARLEATLATLKHFTPRTEDRPSALSLCSPLGRRGHSLYYYLTGQMYESAVPTLDLTLSSQEDSQPVITLPTARPRTSSAGPSTSAKQRTYIDQGEPPIAKARAFFPSAVANAITARLSVQDEHMLPIGLLQNGRCFIKNVASEEAAAEGRAACKNYNWAFQWWREQLQITMGSECCQSWQAWSEVSSKVTKQGDTVWEHSFMNLLAQPTAPCPNFVPQHKSKFLVGGCCVCAI
jgi:hypothetical protein